MNDSGPTASTSACGDADYTDQPKSTKNNKTTVPAANITNVLILGETANGKSTLIRQLGVYAGDPNPNVGIGYGICSPIIAAQVVGSGRS
jgi:predicted GTPase